MNLNFWKNKKVLLTGHTGFKGSWLSTWLKKLGAELIGISKDTPTVPSLFELAQVSQKMVSITGDINEIDDLEKIVSKYKPEIVIHMAAQSLVRKSYESPIDTFTTNVIGTANLLDVVKRIGGTRVFINVTSDKCYANTNQVNGFSEDSPMGGYDPYSSSKGCAELVTSAYRRSFLQNQGIGLASVRAGNVIGGGDWAENRLIPDILRSFEKNKSVVIRNPKATRPWQHVLEPLSGYLILAQKMYDDKNKYAEGWNFGPNEKDVKSVDWILDKMINKWPDASWKLDRDSSPYEAGFLQLDIAKTKSKLGWRPVWELSYTLEKIISWHKAWLDKEDMQVICLEQIEEYMKDMNNENS